MNHNNNDSFKNNRKTELWLFLSFLILLLFIGLDQITKYLAVTQLKEHAPISVFGDLLQLYYLENTGAAWGIFSGKTLFLLLITLIVLCFLIYLYCKIPTKHRFDGLRLCLLLISSGAVGNMIDRIVHHYVIDFLYIKIIDFPVFNVADIYVTVGAVLFVILLCFIYKEEELSFLFCFKEKKEN